MSYQPERVEQVVVKMTCKEVTPEVARIIKKLFKDATVESGAGATANFTFNFTVEYFNVVKAMQQIEVLLDTGKVKMVSTEEITQVKCLAQDFFNKIEKLEKRLARRSQ